jgi:hypothetical protein
LSVLDLKRRRFCFPLFAVVRGAFRLEPGVTNSILS